MNIARPTGILVTRSLVLFSLAAGATACGGSSDNDAGDARRDVVRRDEGVSDTGIVDSGDFDAADEGVDAAVVDVVTPTDGSSDAGMALAFDPMHNFAYYPVARLGRADQTDLGGGTSDTSPFVILRPGAVIPAEDTAGDCVWHSVRLTGSVDKNNATDMDFGAISFTQGTMSTACARNPTTMRYECDSALAPMLAFGANTTFAATGGPDGAAATAMMTFPPSLVRTAIHPPAVLSRTTDNTIRVDVPAGISADTALAWYTFDSARGNLVVCAAPASRGMLVVPARMIMRYAAGSVVNASIYYSRVQSVMLGTHAVDFRLESTVVLPLPVN